MEHLGYIYLSEKFQEFTKNTPLEPITRTALFYR